MDNNNKFNAVFGATGGGGSQGTQGTTGTTGTVGSQGVQGTTGAVGSQGTTGTTGQVGSQGTTGTTGAVGSQGTTGTTGAVGSQGTTGTTGTTGAVGSQGVQGVQGVNSGNNIMFFNTNGSNLANAEDYFITVGTSMGATENSSTKIPIPAGTLTNYSIVSYVGGSFASSEASSVTFVWADGSSEELLSNAVLFDARNNKITGTKSVAVTESYGWIRLDTPTFSSNPSATKILIILTFKS